LLSVLTIIRYHVNNFIPKDYRNGVTIMQFHPGQSGNPAGRPPGARNKKTLEMEELLAQRAAGTVREILDRADRGEPAAMRLCMERMGANRPVAIELPRIDTPDDVAAATRVIMKALAAGAISAREAINLLSVVERLSRLAERVQQMRERHQVWLTPSQASLREAGRAALAAVEEEGSEGSDLYSAVNPDAAPEAEPLYSPVNSAAAAAGPESSDAAVPTETAREGLYSPVNSSGNATARPKSAPAPGSVLKRRRRALMESVAPAALLLGGGLPVDPRSYVTDQTWLASLLETGLQGAAKRAAA
jgi:hypothetical protein